MGRVGLQVVGRLERVGLAALVALAVVGLADGLQVRVVSVMAEDCSFDFELKVLLASVIVERECTFHVVN